MADPLPQIQIVDSRLKRDVVRLWSDLSPHARETLFLLLSRLLPPDDDMLHSLRLMQEHPNQDLRWMASIGTFDDSPYPDSGWDTGRRIREAERNQEPGAEDYELVEDANS